MSTELLDLLAKLAVASIVVYGIATIIAEYEGPFDIFERLRGLSRLFSCSICLSIYIAIPLAIVFNIGVVGYLGIIGGVLIIDRSISS